MCRVVAVILSLYAVCGGFVAALCMSPFALAAVFSGDLMGAAGLGLHLTLAIAIAMVGIYVTPQQRLWAQQ